MENSYFKWDDDLETGINSIDDQHRGLIEIINNILQLCFSNEKIDENLIEETYENLSLYVEEHFKSEEQLMIDNLVDSRHVNSHFNIHAEFEKTIKQFFSDISLLVNPDKLGEIGEFLIRWLAYHILNVDKSLVRQINAINQDKISPNDAYEQEQNFIEISTEPLLKALRSLFYLVAKKNKALSKANAELEEKVQLRTNELLEANKRLKSVSMEDELTGLPNRRYAIIEIEQLINSCRRYGGTFSLLYIDVDKFKVVNDSYGHEYGDKVLKWIADFLRTNLRKSDIPCRLGGDEFVVICSNCDAKNAMEIGIKLNEKCKVCNLDELVNYWNPSLSIGVAEIDNNCKTVSDILKKADSAMYLSKKEGGGLVILA